MATIAGQTPHFVVEATASPCVTDPAFNEVRPPQMCSIDALPPQRSNAQVIGTFPIAPADFERVNDPNYPWQKYRDYTGNPGAYEEMTRIKALQLAEVDKYLVTRSRYWLRQDPVQYPDETIVTITTHHGLTTHHGQTQDMTITQTISIGLGLNFSAPLGEGEPVPPPVPMARVAAAGEGDGDGDGGSGSSGLHFSYDFTKTLHISQTDDITYMDERTEQVQVTYAGGYLYLPWDLAEDLVLERQLKKGGAPQETARMTGITKRKWTQKFHLDEASS